MEIVVAASDEQWQALTKTRPQVIWQRVDNGHEFINYKTASVYFNLNSNALLPGYTSLGKPVIIHSVIDTLHELNAPENVLRINGWHGFLQRPAWEIAGKIDENTMLAFETLNIRTHLVSDEPGFIAARIIAMIINEAYLALEDGVSSKSEIDTAMKLGTNYPMGPFEWGAAIGTENILALLEKLTQLGKRWQPAGLLIEEVNKKTE